MAQMVPKASYDHIVLLTDLTSRSNSALSYARAFAQYYESRLTLVHALPRRSFVVPRTPASNEHSVSTAEAQLQSIADGLRTGGIDVHVHLVEASSRADGILRSFRRLQFRPDLIIQGTAGIDDPRRAVVGSFAESIFRRTKIPVLTVGAQVMPFMEKGLRFDQILFLTDFGSQVNNAAIYALSLAQEFRSQISLCHVHDGQAAPWNKQDIQQYFEHALAQHIVPQVKDWCDPECVVAFGEDIDTEIRLLMNQRKPDLIITAAHSLGPLGTRGKPGTAFKIIANAECPVLTILGAPVKAENPVHPDNRPDMIAYC
jgi:nucleotide-binding universal stress UspA family protein